MGKLCQMGIRLSMRIRWLSSNNKRKIIIRIIKYQHNTIYSKLIIFKIYPEFIGIIKYSNIYNYLC